MEPRSSYDVALLDMRRFCHQWPLCPPPPPPPPAVSEKCGRRPTRNSPRKKANALYCGIVWNWMPCQESDIQICTPLLGLLSCTPAAGSETVSKLQTTHTAVGVLHKKQVNQLDACFIVRGEIRSVFFAPFNRDHCHFGGPLQTNKRDTDSWSTWEGDQKI